jgi:hypothetical protein
LGEKVVNLHEIDSMIAYLFSNAGIRPLIPDGLKPNHKKGSLFKIMVVSYIFNQSVIMRAKERILKLSGFVLSAAVDVSVVYAEDIQDLPSDVVCARPIEGPRL